MHSLKAAANTACARSSQGQMQYRRVSCKGYSHRSCMCGAVSGHPQVVYYQGVLKFPLVFGIHSSCSKEIVQHLLYEDIRNAVIKMHARCPIVVFLFT